ncbi:alpha/beta fold hydrolase [Sorangium sp. So ce1128]
MVEISAHVVVLAVHRLREVREPAGSVGRPDPVAGAPTLRRRLGAIDVPTLVLWGESDQIVDVEYGRAYADAIPTARFQLLTGTGHVPQIETPRLLLGPIWTFAASHATR